jgi:excisionase family DNA binding protein
MGNRTDLRAVETECGEPPRAWPDLEGGRGLNRRSGTPASSVQHDSASDDPYRGEKIHAILGKPFWTYHEAAQVLGISVKTLRNMKWRRELSYSMFGRRIYLSRDLILKELRRNLVLCPRTAAGEGRRRAA